MGKTAREQGDLPPAPVSKGWWNQLSLSCISTASNLARVFGQGGVKVPSYRWIARGRIGRHKKGRKLFELPGLFCTSWDVWWRWALLNCALQRRICVVLARFPITVTVKVTAAVWALNGWWNPRSLSLMTVIKPVPPPPRGRPARALISYCRRSDKNSAPQKPWACQGRSPAHPSQTRSAAGVRFRHPAPLAAIAAGHLLDSLEVLQMRYRTRIHSQKTQMWDRWQN